MKNGQNLYSILPLRVHEGERQRLFVQLEPKPEWIENTPHTFTGEVTLDGWIEFENDCVYIEADIQVPVEFVCDRCGTSFEKNLNATADATYSEVGEYEKPTEIELEYKIVSNRIDLEPLVRDAILENMPSMVLCNENCKGLCPNCGENLNISTCRCKKI